MPNQTPTSGVQRTSRIATVRIAGAKPPLPNPDTSLLELGLTGQETALDVARAQLVVSLEILATLRALHVTCSNMAGDYQSPSQYLG